MAGKSSFRLTLHEAMVLELLEQKLATGSPTMSNHALAVAVQKRDSFRQKNGKWAPAEQIFLRARRYAALFDHSGDAKSCVVALRQLKYGGG